MASRRFANGWAILDLGDRVVKIPLDKVYCQIMQEMNATGQLSAVSSLWVFVGN
jgi:hypothetical protein